MKATVIIPNYNGKKYIRGCLDSLRLQSEKDFDILVVDNDSKDGSVDIILEEYPQVRLIRNDKNYGFSYAVNVGIKASTAKYVILLNNDTVAHKDFVKELILAMERSDRIFSCGSRMIQYHNHNKLDDAGDFYTILGWSYQRGLDESVGKYKKRQRVFSACAGAAIYRREIFQRIGYFDEEHFAYLEDIDMGFRGNIYGYKNYYTPKAVVYHVGHASTGERYNEFKVRLAARNTVFVYYKNLPLIQFLINAPFILAGHFVKYLYFYRKGLGKVYFCGTMEGVSSLKKLKHVPYQKKNFKSYLWIQMSMIRATIHLFGEKIKSRRK